jgi:hypothetical protein
VTYLAEINAVVMEFAEGTQMSNCIRVRHLITARGRRRAIQMVRHAGQWLRCIHTMRLDRAPEKGAFGPSDIYQALLDQVNHLRTLGVDLAGPLWDQALAALEHIPHKERVWCHGDYHLGNLMVLADSGVLGLDAVMDRVDSPYYDLGRFLGDLKTRRSTVLRFGLLPPPGIIGRFRDAFLDGYLDGAPYARLSLALYEGYFIVREWVDILIWVRDTSRLGHHQDNSQYHLPSHRQTVDADGRRCTLILPPEAGMPECRDRCFPWGQEICQQPNVPVLCC